MMRSVLLAFMFSGSVFALSSNAYAQKSPNTEQTDQSEEDWRKSQKKAGDTDDILDIIKNTRGIGAGNGRGYSPVDALPEESRRHLMKERAKRLAQAGPNEPVDVTFNPSDAAKSDSDLEEEEKAAWEKLAEGLNGTPGNDQGGQPGQQGQGQQGQQGQGQQGQQGQGQAQQGQQGQSGGGQSSDSASAQNRSSSIMRGGSSASVADIMAQIKGIGSAPVSGGQGGGTSPTGQPQGFGQGQQQGQQGQEQSQGGGTSSTGQQQGQQNSSPDQAQDASQSQSQSASAAAAAQARDAAHSQSHNQAQNQNQSQQSSRTPEAISPLDRLKQVRDEKNNGGSQSSASDFLKNKN